MHDPYDPPFFSSSQGLRSTLTAIVFIVTAFHLLLLGISIYGKTPIPRLTPPAKIIVQTVRLNPLAARNPAEPADSFPLLLP